MTTPVLQGKNSFSLSTHEAWIHEEGKATDWAGAHDLMTQRPDIGWIVARYIDLSTPDNLRPNDNGHIFLMQDGIDNGPMIVNTPLNWLHRDQLIVGHYTAQQIVENVGMKDADPVGGASIETLAAFYRAVHQRLWQKAKDAHDAGLLWQSMEAVPETVTCQLAGCCGKTFPFAGVWSPTYCASMQKAGRQFTLNNPLFLGGGVVVPPHRPGWRDANALEIATWMQRNADAAEAMYDHIATVKPGLDATQVEAVLYALAKAADVDAGDGPRTFTMPDGLPDLSELLAAPRPRPTLDASIRRTEMIEAAAAETGVIVALVPPPEISNPLSALGTEPVDQIHVTLAFLGDSAGDDTIDGPLGPIQRDQVTAAVAVFAASENPFHAMISGLGRFGLPNGSEVTYASVDAPGLNELRARLVEYLAAVGIPVSADHGFTPHASLQFHLPGEGPTELPEGLEWDASTIEVWWADEHFPYNLGGGGTVNQIAAGLATQAIANLGDQLDDATVQTLKAFAATASPETLAAAIAAAQPAASAILQAALPSPITTDS